MLKAPCYVLSDAHLGSPAPTSSARSSPFCATSREHAGSLIDQRRSLRVLVRVATVIPRGAFRTVAALGDVVDAGVQVLMVAGNHDCWGGDVLRNDVGVDYRLAL